MKKHITILFLMESVLLLAGCSAFTTVQTVQPTPIVITSAPQIIIVTATPEPTLPPTETPLPTSTPLATETALVLPSATATTAAVVPTNTAALPAYTATATTPPSSYDASGKPISASGTIKITGIKDNNSGKAYITWTATGSQSQPFWIYYSESYQYPYYGGYPMWKVSDSAARSAYLEGEAGKTYWIRICHYTGSGCEYYSNPVQYSFPSATVTP